MRLYFVCGQALLNKRPCSGKVFFANSRYCVFFHGFLSVRLACSAVGISETCYRYQSRLSSENAEVADWLIRLTHTHRHWGFGLCFLYLRNVKGYGWNHKRVYRIYRELELNLRIKPKKRLIREAPDKLVEPKGIHDTWSMDFMHDQLSDSRRFRAFNLMTLTGKAYAWQWTSRCRQNVLHAPWSR